MRWIKNNIGLIVTLVVLLALIGAAVVFLLSGIEADKDATKKFSDVKAKYQAAVGAAYYPNDGNISTATSDTEWLSGFVQEVKPLLEHPVPPAVDAIVFKSQLETAIAELNQEASTLGIELPARYGFTFAAQRTMVQFPPGSIPVLSDQLEEIKALCRVLFDSRVHSIDSLQRVRAYPQEATSGNDYLGNKISVTNAIGAVISPYSLSFRGFTSELNSVINGLQNSPTFFVVKAIESVPLVSRSAAPTGGAAMAAATMAGATSRSTRPATTSTTTADPAEAAVPGKLETILDETPVRFILHLEVVKIPVNVAAGAGAAGAVTNAPAMQGM